MKIENSCAALHFCGNNETQLFKSFGGKIIKKRGITNLRKRKKERNTFIQQGNIKLVKSDSKEIYNVTKKNQLQVNVDILIFVLIKQSIKMYYICFQH